MSSSRAPSLLQAQTDGVSSDDPIAAFLAREQARCAAVAAVVGASLAAVQAALHQSGAATSPDTLAVIATLLQGNTPERWQAAWAGPSEAPAFLSALAQRAAGGAELCRRHANNAVIGSNEPAPLDHLFDVHGLVSTLRHVCAAEQGVAIDALSLRTVWDMHEAAGTCAAPLAVSGLAIEGAVFDGRALVHVAPDAPATAPLQPVVIAWVQSQPRKRDAVSFALPVYVSAQRQQLLLQLPVPVRSAVQAHELALAGAAAFVEA